MKERDDYSAGTAIGKGVATAIDAFLPGVGTYLQDTAINQWLDKKEYRKTLEEARSKALKYQNLNAQQQLALTEIETALSDLKSSPSRATNRGEMAKTLKARRSQIYKNVNAYSQLAEQYNNAANPSAGESSNDIKNKLEIADNLADKYEQKI